ncbi:MAG: hypothetical protein K2X10_08710 [Hyphomicrobiales bacterium]|nr:hypothetical protein [Hyphomicrobiales bacterium]
MLRVSERWTQNRQASAASPRSTIRDVPVSTIEYRATTVIAVHRVLSAHELVKG